MAPRAAACILTARCKGLHIGRRRKRAGRTTPAGAGDELRGEQRARREAETLLAISQAVSSTLDPAEALRRVAREIARLLGADMVGAYLADARGEHLRPLAGYHVPKDMLEAFTRHPIPLRGHAVMEQVWASRRAVWSDDVRTDPRVDRATLARFPHQSSLFVPMVVRDQAMGGFFVVWWGARRVINDEEIRLVETIGRQAGLAVEKAQLYHRAEEANRAKDEFLAILSHELRTPLTAILGWVRMLRDGRLSGERAAWALESVERNTRIQVRLINDLLDVSRIVAGKLQLERRTVDLADLTRQVVDTLRPEAELKEVQLTAAVPGALLVAGDPVRLQQIAVNLVSNALKFTPAGGRVDVTLAGDASAVRLTVADSGVGIDPAVLPSIFERFQQADRTVSRSHGGLGLGLAIVRHLAELHGGRVTAASEGPGRGATFVVELPARAAPDVEHPTAGAGAAGVEGPGERAAAGLEGISILVVDDHVDSRALVRTILESRGARVHDVASGPAALEILGRARIDVLISDIGMPGMTGCDLMRAVRRGEQAAARPALPALALTAYAAEEDEAEALAAGFDAHARKPIDPDALVAVVSRLVERLDGPVRSAPGAGSRQPESSRGTRSRRSRRPGGHRSER